jgi:hypothetical protein
MKIPSEKVYIYSSNCAGVRASQSINCASMKTNTLDTLERNAPASEKEIAPKSQLTILLLVCVALAVGGCETLESTSPGEPYGQPAYTGGHGFASSLSGSWFHNGKPTSIHVQPDGRNLMIINEQGQRSSGYAISPYELEIPSLGIRGHVSHGGRSISWTNGTQWTREQHQSGIYIHTGS